MSTTPVDPALEALFAYLQGAQARGMAYLALQRRGFPHPDDGQIEMVLNEVGMVLGERFRRRAVPPSRAEVERCSNDQIDRVATRPGELEWGRRWKHRVRRTDLTEQAVGPARTGTEPDAATVTVDMERLAHRALVDGPRRPLTTCAAAAVLGLVELMAMAEQVPGTGEPVNRAVHARAFPHQLAPLPVSFRGPDDHLDDRTRTALAAARREVRTLLAPLGPEAP
jgi:hypothetical protein